MQNSEMSAGTNAEQSNEVEVPTSSQTIAKPHVSRRCSSCDQCFGTGEVEKNIWRGEEGMQIEMDVMVVCSQCNGTGLLPITDAERTSLQDCCIYPHYYDGKEIAAKILTEDSEGSFLDPEDLIRLSDVLYRYVKGNGG